ncbi:cyclin-domain-containing protein [Tricladium varicosporioides]|nr:cyclin-domain-containing protein [Hymenoscyphus varicosporioides]
MHRTAARPAPLDLRTPSTHSSYDIDRRKDFGLAQAQPLTNYLQATIRDGLHTPPADDMGTTYQQPQYTPYGSRQDSAYAAGPSSGGYAGAYSGHSGHGRQYSSHSSSTISSQSSTSTLRHEVPQHSLYRQPTSPQASQRTSTLAAQEEEPRRRSTNGDMILPNLRIPETINDSGGSLAEFAAQITCLFWFEPTETLNKAESLSSSSSPIKRLRDEAIPSTGFRKWVVTILSTTQVTQNVILLALLFIYRLKKINPAVKGRSGSEYRLLTVALMLGNKFLDDNTYTNKTWAEVSGISVNEIHVMEVEFLSNMRYSLLASEDQWKEWHEKLGRFWTYCDRAMRAPVVAPTLPSPPTPVSMQSSPPSHTLSSAYSASSTGSSLYSHQWPINPYAAPLTSPLPSMPEHDLRSSARKRSHEGEVEEPAAKRVTRPATTGPATFTSNAPAMRSDLPRLPVPNLTISTSQAMNHNYNGATSMSQNVPLLPPLNGRAMATVYPTTPSWTPNLPVLTPTGPPSQHGPSSANGYTTPSRRTSPHSVHDLLSLGSSPISGHFPGNNPGHISPSFFLQQRNSPYKPVRHVNTLLFPPPSSGFNSNVDQMHYQPLGRRNDYRTGIVPEYAHQGPYQHYPVLPQPNFHA